MAAVVRNNPVIQREWITPHKQLIKFKAGENLAIVKEIEKKFVGSNDQQGCMSHRNCALLVAQYAYEQFTYLTHWHTALDTLSLLPDQIPYLPYDEITPILDSLCPIRGHERKADGTPYRVRDTHSLYLMLPTPWKQLLKCVHAYGNQHLDAGVNSFGFAISNTLLESFVEKGYLPPELPYWTLSSNEVLPHSSRPTKDQDEMIRALCERTSINYEKPHLREITQIAFYRKIATGIRMIRNEDRNYVRMHSQSGAVDWAADISFGPLGLWICVSEDRDIWNSDNDDDDIGYTKFKVSTLVLRKFGVPMREMEERQYIT